MFSVPNRPFQTNPADVLFRLVPQELNKQLIIDSHQALDRRGVFVVGECTHKRFGMEREVGSYTSGFIFWSFIFFFALFCLDGAINIPSSNFKCLQGSFRWRTLPFFVQSLYSFTTPLQYGSLSKDPCAAVNINKRRAKEVSIFIAFHIKFW